MFSKYREEQPIAYQILNNTIKKQNISHAYLFISNNYSKTMDFAITFAKEIILKDITDNQVKENIANQINNGTYNNLILIDPEGIIIKKEVVENLQKELSNKSIDGNKRIYIINNCEKLNTQSSNSILKFLEEPEEDIIAILITDNKYQLLETITSRCLNIRLQDDKAPTEDNLSTKEKIGMNLFNKTDEMNEFINNSHTDEFIDNLVKFIVHYEKNRIQTLLYLNKIWHEKIKDKSEMILAFDIMILFYNDVLTYKVNNKINIFKDLDDQINEMCKNNTMDQICHKLDVLIKSKRKIRNNVNSKLLMDKLVINFGGENCD
ncbi:MAG: hypothetical protein PHI05_00780 [Bacilli bacterium]|nr:hypothetical protein [Bacilli bacterium]MDD4547275.1 hypothetical protein [Bacilli bacterium]